MALVDFGAHLSRQIGRIDNVFDSDRHAVECPAAGTPVERARLPDRQIRIHRGPGFHDRLARLAPREAVAHHGLGSEFSRRYTLCNFGTGEPVESLRLGGRACRGNMRCLLIHAARPVPNWLRRKMTDSCAERNAQSIRATRTP